MINIVPILISFLPKILNRWEMKAMEDLPEYMKVCYVALLNFANEMFCGVIKDHGFNTLPYIKGEVS